MPKVLEADSPEEAIAENAAFEEESWTLGSTDNAPDLSDGGMVNGVKVRPARDKTVTKGRPAARRAWMANGTETLLPLAWEPDGRSHDSGMRYFRKRLCLCCQRGGFKGIQCPDCVKNSCSLCNGSTDRKKIIPCFYRRREDAPFAVQFYGSVDCFLRSCVRRDTQGFVTQTDMRLHARSMHKLEYQAYIEGQQASKADEVAELRKRVDDLMGKMAQGLPLASNAQSAQANGRKWSKERREAASKRAKERIANG